MVECTECGCVSADGRGWLAFVCRDPDEEAATLAVYCPWCSHREFQKPRVVPDFL
ncbi:MAG: hypothetical protein ACM33B_05475 [Pseudomonadota bacterium]